MAPAGRVRPAEPAAGWVARELVEELPGLGLCQLTAAARARRSSRALRDQLRRLSDRFRGPQAVALRRDPIPHAYRAFYRHVGLDPDATRTPMEAMAVERLMQGGFVSRNTLDDAIAVVLVEHGVPVWALDAERVEGALGLRLAAAGERLGAAPGAPPAPAGRIVVADDRRPLAVLFGDVAPGHGVVAATRRIALFAVRVPGVPAIHVEEALWACREILVAG